MHRFPIVVGCWNAFLLILQERNGNPSIELIFWMFFYDQSDIGDEYHYLFVC